MLCSKAPCDHVCIRSSQFCFQPSWLTLVNCHEFNGRFKASLPQTSNGHHWKRGVNHAIPPLETDTFPCFSLVKSLWLKMKSQSLAGKIHPNQRFFRLKTKVGDFHRAAEVIKMDGGRAQAKYTVEASYEDDLCPKRTGGSSKKKISGTKWDIKPTRWRFLDVNLKINILMGFELDIMGFYLDCMGINHLIYLGAFENEIHSTPNGNFNREDDD